MAYLLPDSKILIFAKAPVPGMVKTRLIGKLTEQQAANLHAKMLNNTINMVLSSNIAPLSLYCSPDTSHEIFQNYADSGMKLEKQYGDSLGSRMCHAFEETLAHASNVILIGTDCPVMNQQYLFDAFKKFKKYNIVLGPAEDGGYVLVGQKEFNPEMFKDINWGTSEVLNETRRQLQKQKSNWYELKMLWDIDRPEDLAREGISNLL